MAKPNNMDNKFFYLYLVAGTLALVLLFCQVYMPRSIPYDMFRMYGYIIAVAAFYYLAFKAYHAKKDKELM